MKSGLKFIGLGEAVIKTATLQRESGILWHTDGIGMINFLIIPQQVKAPHYISYILFPYSSCHLGVPETILLYSVIIISITKPFLCCIYLLIHALFHLIITTISRFNYYTHFTAQIILLNILLWRSWAKSETVLKSPKKMLCKC